METIPDIVERLRAEYLEMPGLLLTAEQVQRFCGIERTACQSVLEALISAKFLAEKPDGHYARLTEGQCTSLRSAKADLRMNGVDEYKVSRQPERRRARSDDEMRRERNRLERQWNDEHRPRDARQEIGSAADATQPAVVTVPAGGKRAS